MLAGALSPSVPSSLLRRPTPFLTFPICIDRGHPLHPFGDMVYTSCPLEMRQEVDHSLEGDVDDVPET